MTDFLRDFALHAEISWETFLERATICVRSRLE